MQHSRLIEDLQHIDLDNCHLIRQIGVMLYMTLLLPQFGKITKVSRNNVVYHYCLDLLDWTFACT